VEISFISATIETNTNKVWTHNGKLFVQTQSATKAHVYRLTGSLEKTIDVTTGKIAEVQLAKGFYVVALDGASYKVVVQ
jgi:hypothetical protein